MSFFFAMNAVYRSTTHTHTHTIMLLLSQFISLPMTRKVKWNCIFTFSTSPLSLFSIKTMYFFHSGEFCSFYSLCLSELGSLRKVLKIYAHSISRLMNTEEVKVINLIWYSLFLFKQNWSPVKWPCSVFPVATMYAGIPFSELYFFSILRDALVFGSPLCYHLGHAKLNLLEQNLLNELSSLWKFECVFKIANEYFGSQVLKGQNIAFSKSGLDFCFYTLVLTHLVICRVGKMFSHLSY